MGESQGHDTNAFGMGQAVPTHLLLLSPLHPSLLAESRGTQALGSSEMGLVSASGDLLQGEGAEQNFVGGGNTVMWRWSQPCRLAWAIP